jgi:uncharacterized protein (DUF433 family)
MQTQSRSDALVAAHIEQNPNRPGKDEARLKRSGVSVWAIIGYWKANNGDVAGTAAEYAVPIEAVEAAVAYYERHKALIDNRLAANDPEEEDRVRDMLLHDPDERIRRYLEPDPRYLGAAEVRLKGYGVSVWAIIGYWKGVGDLAEVAAGYDVPIEAVKAAVAYYERRREIIDARLDANLTA